MSPILARPHYFITVLNQKEANHVIAEGSLEKELRALLLDLAESVQFQRDISTDTVERINDAFQQYQALRLKLSILNASDALFMQGGNGRQYAGQQIVVHSEFADDASDVRRIYMEAILSLLAAMEQGQLELQRCIHCHNWYMPYQRAQVTKFCSAKCRNRSNYVQKQKKPTITV